MAKEKIVKFSTIIWQRSVKFLANFEIDKAFICISYNTTKISIDKSDFIDFMNPNIIKCHIGVIVAHGALPQNGFIPSSAVAFHADMSQQYFDTKKHISRSGNPQEAILAIDSDPLNSICLPMDVLKQQLDYYDQINKR
ncbi:MAG: hypothetical protein FWF97_01995 [Alphaproteobacteria bacterium]|nr:hypothetical protein [Alphaproteobacteria bacterium]